MTTETRYDALALLTLATNGDLPGALRYIDDMARNGVDAGNVILDLAGLGGVAVHKMAEYSGCSVEHILSATGQNIAAHEAALADQPTSGAQVFVIRLYDDGDDDD